MSCPCPGLSKFLNALDTLGTCGMRGDLCSATKCRAAKILPSPMVTVRYPQGPLSPARVFPPPQPMVYPPAVINTGGIADPNLPNTIPSSSASVVVGPCRSC